MGVWVLKSKAVSHVFKCLLLFSISPCNCTRFILFFVMSARITNFSGQNTILVPITALCELVGSRDMWKPLHSSSPVNSHIFSLVKVPKTPRGRGLNQKITNKIKLL